MFYHSCEFHLVLHDIILASMNNLNQQIALVERISFMHNHALDVARNRSRDCALHLQVDASGVGTR